MYELVREIVEMVCKLLTIVEAVMRHPDVPSHKLGNLESAKEGLYNVTSSLAESVRLLTLSLPPTMSDEEEKQMLLQSATGALKAGADCMAAVKMCLNRSVGETPFIIHLPTDGQPGPEAFTPSKFAKSPLGKVTSLVALKGYRPGDDEDLTIQGHTPPPTVPTEPRESSLKSGNSSKSSRKSEETNETSPDERKTLAPLAIPLSPIEPDLPSPTLFARTDDGTTWEGSAWEHGKTLEEKIINGDLPSVPLEPIPEFIQDPVA
jgi:hypothetical protein